LVEKSILLLLAQRRTTTCLLVFLDETREVRFQPLYVWRCGGPSVALIGCRDDGQEPALAKAGVGELGLPAIEQGGPIEAWIIDDTGFPKKGRHSVGVTRQYCGQLGKQDNCQAAVSLSLANHDASLPVAYRFYLPEDWAEDQARWHKAKIPETITFRTKPEIAFEQIKATSAAGLPEGVVFMDAGYGNDTGLRTDITALGLRYVAGIGLNTSVWPPGGAPVPPQSRTGRGRGCTADSTNRSRSGPWPSGCRHRPGK
jgi:SRSO17 transposase